MRNWTVILLLTMLPSLSWGQTQTYYQYKTDEATLVFFDNPGVLRQKSLALHSSHDTYVSEWQGASQADLDHRLRV